MPEDVPRCGGCGRELDRIDRYAIEHTILDRDKYRDVSVDDGGVEAKFGLASETDLRCGYCGCPLPREQRAYFYRRWVWTKNAPRDISARQG